MFHAYSELYLEDAQRSMGDMMEYAVYVCGMDADAFFLRFLRSGLAERFGSGNPWLLGHRSGAELAEEVLFWMTGERRGVEPLRSNAETPEYWAGRTLAYYQWYTGRRFRDIHEALPFSEVVRLYPAMHKEDISRFVQYAETRMRAVWENRLKKRREVCELSQEALAERSGVPLREIQAYEQEKHGVNKAPADTVYRLARTLSATMETLLEFPLEDLDNV